MPETVRMSKRDAMTAKAVSLLGCGYIYGATGWICTRSRLDQQARQYPEYANLIYRYGPKWMGLPCYDCAQLTRAVAAEAGVSLPSGSWSQWRAQGVWAQIGTIDSLPDEAGIFLFTQTGVKMTHTGVSIGSGEEIDARGHAYGVVRRKVEDTSFTHWAKLAVDYDAPADLREDIEVLEPRRTLRRGMSGEDVALLQRRLMELGYSLSPYGADGKYGTVTQSAVRQFQRDHALSADGVAGSLTWAMIDGLNG